MLASDKELACAKERQEIEMAAQRATLQEQRTHIDILDTALTNAQANVVRLEEEVSELYHNFFKDYSHIRNTHPVLLGTLQTSIRRTQKYPNSD